MTRYTKIDLRSTYEKTPAIIWLKDTAPALLVILASLFIALFVSEFVFVSGVRASWKILFRFVRTSLVLIVPVLILPLTCSFLRPALNRSGRKLVQIREERIRSIRLLEAWAVRHLQGIGLSMLLATKLISVFQVYTGTRISGSLLFPAKGFVPGKFVATTAIFASASFLLSFLWTLDDLGIRHYNKKTGEVRMIGKYLGVILPTIFGFYGLTSLYGEYTQSLAVQYVGQIAIILYPPFVMLAVFHNRYIQKWEGSLLKRLKTSPYHMARPEKEQVFPMIDDRDEG